MQCYDPGPCCKKLIIDGNFAINGNYHGNRAQQPIKIKVSMVVTIDGKVTINGKFCATGPWALGLYPSQILSISKKATKFFANLSN